MALVSSGETAPRACVLCYKHTPLVCARCRVAHFCSVAHWQHDAPFHAEFCRAGSASASWLTALHDAVVTRRVVITRARLATFDTDALTRALAASIFVLHVTPAARARLALSGADTPTHLQLLLLAPTASVREERGFTVTHASHHLTYVYARREIRLH